MAPPPPPGSAEKHKGKARRSKYVGVYWVKLDCKWVARISHEGKLKGKGRFSTEEEAARAFDDAARELRGGAAHGAKFSLNFPTEAEKQEAAAAAAAAASADGLNPPLSGDIWLRPPTFDPTGAPERRSSTPNAQCEQRMRSRSG